MTETKNEPSKAGMNPSTEKPWINEAANQNNAAFITNVNKPRVSSVIGKVNKIRIGLTIRLSTPKITAAIEAI